MSAIRSTNFLIRKALDRPIVIPKRTRAVRTTVVKDISKQSFYKIRRMYSVAVLPCLSRTVGSGFSSHVDRLF